MAIESASDLAGYFDTEAFGVAALYTPSGGSGSSISVILNREFVAVESGGTVGVESYSPVVHCRLSDVTNIGHGDTFVISSTTYTVVEVEKDVTQTMVRAMCRE
jgi:hypothetical protein